MTNLKDEQNVTGSSYGTMIIIRKALISEMGWHASISFTLFDETQCGRGLGILKLDTPESKQSVGSLYITSQKSVEALVAFTDYCVQLALRARHHHTSDSVSSNALHP
jgi:hypothetical protein